MSIEDSHGAARPTLPRSRNLATVESVPSRTKGRDANGRFASGNPYSGEAKWRSLMARTLGRDLQGEAGKLAQEAYRHYRAYLADLPCDCASVRSLVAQRARAATLAARYALRGMELGETTELGAQCLAEALKWDQRAERLAVTSLDVSSKLVAVAKARKPDDVHAKVLDVFGKGDR
jgi:hypothetical protein